MSMDKNILKEKGMELKPTVQVGKSGLTDGIVKEIDSQLEKRELVKIKFLRSAGPSSYWKDNIFRISNDLKAQLVEIKGGTVIIFRERKG